MPLDKGLAPAKINLALHVTGVRAGGYHLLDSIVAFAGVGDQLTALPASELSLEVTGPFSRGVPADETNSVLRAARMLQEARGVAQGAKLKLTKTLPHAAGIGSGSSDAAATLRLLSQIWGVENFAPNDPEVLELGADVPVCLHAPHPARMRGIGEVLEPLPALPACGLVLVNPGVEVPTGRVFDKLERSDNAGMDELPEALDYPGFVEWLGAQRNDLQAPAEAIAPEIARALKRLRAMPGVDLALMSGSGATCIGLTRDMGRARQVARAIQLSEMGWWVAPAPLLS
ncbi:4-(cytidine 5'-diphospho)-2-C-methyl-D-erythritol kinase [Limimaricola sp. G21655-S1]|uniref:4-(cytidine 5'-diphospho)-2-C-methyl-D-erythritol kinase n=1 Tax=Limimaricola sp. G21655-S1 TaxID=3014768 RepID=UPI0022B055B2|nr:4-(cytidine 5'-diphospho)-2-C-methyl-D-erythritol kinase [Limimaricola sp. G21655-S1]MCZ4259522.1 4-(cytidine 5'-diphospho)-2-C-methyl-D-erythritol kinase [Limimaricola sp. G21655-S1]